MRNALITVVLASAVAAWLPKQAPVKPDFSGTWKLDPAASVVAPAPGASGGVSPALLEPVIVKQTAETLSVTRDRERENPRSAPTQAVMLPSSTDCWEPAIAMGPRGQVYIVAGQRRGALASKEFDQQQVLWRSFDGGATFEGPWPLDAKGHRQADQRIAVDRDGTIYVTYMDHEDLNPGAPTRLRVARSHDVADHDFPSIAANGETGVCVVWVDDRRGALDTVAQCSTDGAKTWGDDVVLSNRSFTSFYGHYGGASISSRGRLFVVWAEGERDYRTGTVWFNSVPLGH